jgi:hypothetical protein
MVIFHCKARELQLRVSSRSEDEDGDVPFCVDYE